MTEAISLPITVDLNAQEIEREKQNSPPMFRRMTDTQDTSFFSHSNVQMSQIVSDEVEV